MSSSSVGRKKKILVFCDFYLPSTKSGGGMWTVVNMIDRFCDRYDFYVVTRNYDSKGDTNPFTSVKTGEWNRMGNAQVYYVAKSHLNARTAAERVKEIEPDGVYLNSAFSTPTLNFLEARRKRFVDDIPVALAPCGEFSPGALSVKPLKKRAFLVYAKAVKMFRGVTWKASSELEFHEIRNLFGPELQPMIAPDLAPKSILPDFSIGDKRPKVSGQASFMFLSRVVPKKNIQYFLERLTQVKRGHVRFDIVGPLEDRGYWSECRKILKSISSNVEVRTLGAVTYEEGLKLLCEHDFFVLPTLNENFGYVILESLAAGTPILISEHTPWSDTSSARAGWILSLDDPDSWVDQINRCVAMDNLEYLKMSAAARKFAESHLAVDSTEFATAAVLERAFGGNALPAAQSV